MNYFFVGDIHGCYYTLIKLLKTKMIKIISYVLETILTVGYFPEKLFSY
jgi:hypothetical protein